MKAKCKLMLGIIMCGITSYTNELPRQIITDVTELSDIFSEKTLADTEKNMEKLNTKRTYFNVETGSSKEVTGIPKIDLKTGSDGKIYVDNVTTVPIPVISNNEIADNEIIDNKIIDNKIIDNEIIDNEIIDDTAKKETVPVKQKKYLSEDMIKDYYRNIKANNKGRWNYVTKEIEISNNTHTDTVYFTKGVEVKDRRQVSAIYKYFVDNNIKKIKLTGHSDPTGNRKLNAILSVKRSDTIRNMLVNMGIKRENIEIDAKGDKEVIDRQNLLRNRRVEVIYFK